MRLSTFRRGLCAAIIGLAAQFGTAEAGEVQVVKDGDTLVALDGKQIMAKYNENTGQSSHYTYLNGLIWQIASSDHTVSSFSYDKQGKLLRIETTTYTKNRSGKTVPTSMAGMTQQAIYAGSELVALASSTGQRLALEPRLAQQGDLVMQIKNSAKTAMRSKRSTAAERRISFNHWMIAINGWTALSSDWECTKSPQGEDICVGRKPPAEEAPPPGAGDMGGGGGAPYDPPPKMDMPPDNGGDVIGGGGGDGIAINPQIPTNLNTLPSCQAAAYNTYWIMMNQVCKFPKNPLICRQQALTLYEKQMLDCAQMYPG